MNSGNAGNAPRSGLQTRTTTTNPRQLSRRAANYVLAFLGASLLTYVVLFETMIAHAAVALAATSALTFTVAAISRRPLFAGVVTASLLAVILMASLAKRYFLKMLLHAYDIAYYLTSGDHLSFLWINHKPKLISLLFAFVIVVTLGIAAFRFDPIRIARRRAIAGMIVSGTILVPAAMRTGDGELDVVLRNNDALSVFYLSWLELAEAKSLGQSVEAASASSVKPFAPRSPCTPSSKPPHIILIHQESMVPPAYFSGLDYDRSLDSFFQSFDGKIHKLGVEVYGGGSWMTEFSVVSGLPSQSFGGMRQFVMSTMQGKISDTLPQALADCGYRNVLFNPMTDGFAGTGPFYRSIGMHETYDRSAQRASSYAERDKFYYANMLARLKKHVSESNGPIFAFLITMSGHEPYNYKYEPEEDVPGGGPGTHPEIHEYLRRAALAKKDYNDLVSQLKNRFPGEAFLIVQYGDHQPIATRHLLGIASLKSFFGFGKGLGLGDLGYTTFYSVNSVNYRAPSLPNVDRIDVAYLSSLILLAAGLPLPESHSERVRLMELCEGRYHSCKRREEILAYHRRLIDSGLLRVR